MTFAFLRRRDISADAIQPDICTRCSRIKDIFSMWRALITQGCRNLPQQTLREAQCTIIRWPYLFAKTSLCGGPARNTLFVAQMHTNCVKFLPLSHFKIQQPQWQQLYLWIVTQWQQLHRYTRDDLNSWSCARNIFIMLQQIDISCQKCLSHKSEAKYHGNENIACMSALQMVHKGRRRRL